MVYVIIDKDLTKKYVIIKGIENFILKGTGNKKIFKTKEEAEDYRINFGLQRGKIIKI